MDRNWQISSHTLTLSGRNARLSCMTEITSCEMEVPQSFSEQLYTNSTTRSSTCSLTVTQCCQTSLTVLGRSLGESQKTRTVYSFIYNMFKATRLISLLALLQTIDAVPESYDTVTETSTRTRYTCPCDVSPSPTDWNYWYKSTTIPLISTVTISPTSSSSVKSTTSTGTLKSSISSTASSSTTSNYSVKSSTNTTTVQSSSKQLCQLHQ